MNNNEAKVLCGDDLLSCKPSDYKNIPLTMSRSSDTIGIATDDNGAYYVYQKGERNAVDWKKPFDSFDSALEYAKSTYSDFLAFLDYLYGKAHAPDNAVSVEAQEDIRNVTDINDYLIKSLIEAEHQLDQLLKEQKRTHELIIENSLNDKHIAASSLLLKSLIEAEHQLDQLLKEQKRTHELIIENRLNNNHIAASSLPPVARRSRPPMRK